MQTSEGQASWSAKGEGRKLRRARNAVKRYAGKEDPKLADRYARAMAILMQRALTK